MSLVEIPTIVQIDESVMMLGAIEQPNKTLHDIITHKVENRVEDTKSKEDAE